MIARLMVVTAGTAALVAGCGSSTAGQSVAQAPGTQQTSTTTSSPTSSSKVPLTDMSNTTICGLLTAGEATRLGGSEQGRPSYSTNQGQPVCQWSKDTSLNVAFGKNSRSSQAPTGEGVTNTATSVAGLTAVLSHKTGAPESCQVIVDVTNTATMAFLVGLHDGGKGKYEPCDTARRLAEIIIPKVKG